MVCKENLCAKCARIRETCCQNTDIYVTLGDIDRIRRSTQQQDFFEYRAPRNPDYLDQDDDPCWRDHVIQTDGKRRVLKKSESGCCFLGKTGCILPMEVRPLVCRLHPFTYTATGLDAEPDPECPSYLLPEGETLMSSLNMSREEAFGWHHELYKEILLDETDHRTHLRPAL